MTAHLVPFSSVKIGQEFLWGSGHNWARKKTSRTAIWQTPPKSYWQKDCHETWSYWRQNEAVYVFDES